MNLMKWLVITAMILTVVATAWNIDLVTQESRRQANESYFYIGRVTATQQADSCTMVYLDSDKVYGAPLNLKVGEEYEFTLDGNGRLMNVTMITK